MTKRILIPLALSPDSLPVHTVGARVVALRGETMGTTWSVSLVVDRQDVVAANEAIQQALDSVVSQMSTWEASSDLSRFNRASPGAWFDLPAGFFTVLEHALDIAASSGGAYDPTVGPLVDLWGFGPPGGTAMAPSGSAIATARAACGWHKLTLDKSQRRARQPGGLHVDFSGIAKGYGVDQVAQVLRRLGFQSYLVEVGGELRGHGTKPDGEPWWVELEQPLPVGGNGVPIATTLVALHGLAVATSGDYRRYFDADGVRYSHTIDPRTGYPVASPITSVTVLHPECMVADAMATALTVMGVEEGRTWAARHGLAALFITRDDSGLQETLTPAMTAMTE
jgi:thiamine biosynthesis lipoprotein